MRACTCPGNCSGSRIRFGGATKLDYGLFHQEGDGLPRHHPKHTRGVAGQGSLPDLVEQLLESNVMPGARAVRGWSVTAAQLLEGTFGLSLSKASAHQHNHDVEQLLESLSKGSAPPSTVGLGYPSELDCPAVPALSVWQPGLLLPDHPTLLYVCPCPQIAPARCPPRRAR